MSIPEERYVDITRPGETSGGANSGEVRDLKRRLDQHIGSGGQAHSVATETSAGFMSSDDKEKLNGVQNNATENMPDDYLLARGNHTGVQAIETINGLRQELNELGGAELEELVDRAEAEADRAEAASNAAFVNADVYPSFAEGVSGTTEGQQFQIISDNGLELIRYERTETGATEVARYPSAGAVERKADRNHVNGILYANPSSVNVNTSLKTITITSGRLSVGAQSVLITGQTLDYSGATPGLSYYLYADLNTAELGMAQYLPSMNIPLSSIVFCKLSPETGALSGLPEGYTLDGVIQGARSFSVGSLYSQTGTGIAVDTAGRTITVSSARVTSDGSTFTISGQSVGYAESENPFRFLIYRPGSGLRLVASSGLNLLTPTDVFLSPFNMNTGQLDWVSGGYLINGKAVGGASYLNAGLPLSTPGRLNFNFVEKKVELTGNLVVLHGNFRTLIAPQTVDISNIADTLWGALMLDTASGTVLSLPTNTQYDPNYIVLGAYKADERLVTGFDNYSIDGVSSKEAGGVSSTPLYMAWELDGIFTAPSMPDYSASGPQPMALMTSADIYALYDSLMAAYPDYITKTQLGQEATGLPIFEYRFKPDMASVMIDGEFERAYHPRVFLQGGIHNEHLSYVYPYQLMRLICEAWESDPLLEALRWGVEIAVVPCLAPWNIDNNSYVNSAGVNINRNYPIKWVFNDTPGQGSGPFPLSEPETQCSYNLMLDFKPHIFLDCHDFGSSLPTRSLWYPSVSDDYRAVAESTANRLARKWQSENPWMPPASSLALVSSSGMSGISGRTSAALGIAGGTHEVAQDLYYEPDKKRGSPLATRYAVESLGNILIGILRQLGC